MSDRSARIGLAVAVAGLLIALARLLGENKGHRWPWLAAGVAVVVALGITVFPLPSRRPTTHLENSAGRSPEATPSAVTMLRGLLSPPLHSTDGMVAGEPVSNAITLLFGGLGCANSSNSLYALLGRRYSTATMRIAMDDSVDANASARLEVLTDGSIADSLILRHGSGVHVSTDVTDKREIRLDVQALTHSKGKCLPGEYRVYLLEGLVR